MVRVASRLGCSKRLRDVTPQSLDDIAREIEAERIAEEDEAA
jgi:hypothetical protein